MKKLIMIAIVGVVVALIMVSAVADIYRDGPIRDVALPGIKIVMFPGENHRWRIAEDSPLFAASFADVYFADSLLNYAEQKEMAKGVARSVAKFFGSTNTIRVAHWERPEPASTNAIDVFMSKLNAKLVTDEIIPSEFHAR